MFNVRLFLRNHATPCRWADLPADVKRLFASPDGSLAWAEFYVADAARRRGFVFFRRAGTRIQCHRAEVVMLQDTWGLLTLVVRSRRGSGLFTSISLDVATIESAAFGERSGRRRRRKT